MAIDSKYGRVTLEHNGDVGEDEPVVVFRAKDALLPKVLAYYHLFCLKSGSPREHLSLVLDTLDKVVAWQSKNETRTPSSTHFLERTRRSRTWENQFECEPPD